MCHLLLTAQYVCVVTPLCCTYVLAQNKAWPQSSWINVRCSFRNVLQVQRHPVITDRAAEFPSVAPVVTGKPHQYAYTAGSRVTGEDKWGPQQVGLSPLPCCVK